MSTKEQKPALFSPAHRLSLISKMTHAKSYLEIGVRDGATFFDIDIPFKVAVDPNFTFDTKKAAAPGSYFFETTSDDFFENLLKNDRQDTYSALYQQQDKPLFDIIFIDGLHTFEQSLRDFTHSIQFAHKDTVWLLDDTVPCDPYSAHPNLEKSLQIRQQAGINEGAWHGDVFKTVFAIHDLYPTYSYCTLMGGNPQTLVKQGAASSRSPAFSSLDHIGQLGYFDMLDYAELFNLTQGEEESIIQQFIASGTPKAIAERELWKRLIYKQEKSVWTRGLEKFKNQGILGVCAAISKRIKEKL